MARGAKESAAEHLDEWLAESGADFMDEDSGEIDWDAVDQETWWANESKIADKDLIFFWGGWSGGKCRESAKLGSANFNHSAYLIDLSSNCLHHLLIGEDYNAMKLRWSCHSYAFATPPNCAPLRFAVR